MYGVSSSEYAAFLQNKTKLTEELAAAIERQLLSMGNDIKGVAWFSSIGEKYTGQNSKAA